MAAKCYAGYRNTKQKQQKKKKSKQTAGKKLPPHKNPPPHTPHPHPTYTVLFNTPPPPHMLIDKIPSNWGHAHLFFTSKRGLIWIMPIQPGTYTYQPGYTVYMLLHAIWVNWVWVRSGRMFEVTRYFLFMFASSFWRITIAMQNTLLSQNDRK